MSLARTVSAFGRKLTSVVVAVAAAAGLATVGAPTAAAQDTRTYVRPGCVYSPTYAFWVQDCQVWSPAMGQNIKVQIKPAANGGNAGLYLLDGLRARDDWNGWTNLGHGVDQFVDDNVTVVMPVGGAAQFYTDWQAPFGGNNGPRNPKWETFLTRELPGYLEQNFGVSRTNNAVLGLSMGGTAAMNLAAWHRDQFKHASSLSGYLNPAAPYMFPAIDYAMRDASGPVAQAGAMWGPPLSPAWGRNDPFVQAGRFSGLPVYISAATGIPTYRENFLADPIATIVGINLEWLSRVQTQQFEMVSRGAGARVTTSYPGEGIHNWPYWTMELSRVRPQILGALGVAPDPTPVIRPGTPAWGLF